MKILAASKPLPIKRFGRDEVSAAIDRAFHAPVLQQKPVFWALALLCAYFFFMQTLSFISTWDTDSPSYYTAAQGLRAGINIYEDREFQPLADSLFGKGLVVYPYLYPPLLAQICLPLAGLSQSANFLFFYVLNLLLTFLGLYLTIELLELSRCRTLLPALFPFALLLFNEPLLTTIHHGQVNLIVFDAILLSLVFQKKDKPLPATFFLSLAVFIKIYPVLFILPFLFSKRIKYLAAFAANSAALLSFSLLLSGPKPWLDFARSTLDLFLKKPNSPFTQGFQNSFGNVSLKGFLTQGFARLQLPETMVVPVFIALTALLFILIFVIPKKRAISSDPALESSLLFILTLVLAPITWSHHFVIMLFPLSYLFGRIIREKRYAFLPLLAFLGSQILYELPWGAFPYNQVRLLAVLGLLGMLLHFARTSPVNDDAVWGVKGRARREPGEIIPSGASSTLSAPRAEARPYSLRE